jgi:E3 ubiquitin-protein ligase DOA10
MKPTDYVARSCIVNDQSCSLKAKCDMCKKEIADLAIIDRMFEKRILELLRYQVEVEKQDKRQ